MLSEDKYFRDCTKEELWQRYCGFLDLSIDEFMEIQRELLMDEVEKVASSTLGKKIMGRQKPRSIDAFRQMVPLTTYEDYEPYLSERREEALATKIQMWCHSSGRGGRFKWIPLNYEFLEKSTKAWLSVQILAAAKRKGQVDIKPGIQILAMFPPPPYASGSGMQRFTENFSYKAIPPLQMAKNMEFPERLRKGFEIALKDGVDIIGALSSILVKMGEDFANQTRSRKLSKSMLHPRVLFRLFWAVVRSKREKRPMLPKDLWAPKGILCVGMDTSLYKQDIAYYWGSEPFDFYASAETMIFAMQAWNRKEMTFIPDCVFLEFIPQSERLKQQGNNDYQPSTVLLNELREGEIYEVVLTQFYGMPLLRYRLNDIIKVVSIGDEETGIKLPQFIVQGRVNETISLGGLAQLDEKTIWQALANNGIKFIDWSACKEYEQNQSFLRIYLELEDQKEINGIETKIDEQLKIIDTDYKDISIYLDLQPVRVTLLSPGTFGRYTQEKREEGADIAHLKPIHMNAPEAVIQRLLQLSDTT
ncbi:GH3 auxin-responsive promoter family protein [Chloroflexota bacterium]